MGNMGLLALLAMPCSHAGQWASPVTLKPCDTADPHQQWVTAGEGDAGHVRDRASGRCLQVAGCATTAMESKVVVDACDSGCAAATPAAAAWKWTTDDPKNPDVHLRRAPAPAPSSPPPAAAAPDGLPAAGVPAERRLRAHG